MQNPNPQAQIAALQYVMSTILAQLYAPLDVDQVAILRRMTLERLEQQSLAKTSDPAFSDLSSAEVVEAVDQILSAAARIHAEMAPLRST